MGVKSKAAEVVLRDFSGAAASYFGGIKVPASIIFGSCLGLLFALSNFSAQDRNPLERSLVKLYRLLTWSTVVLSLNVVITCTIASITILHGRFDSMAETPYLLLKREFEYEFVSSRWSFAVSLLLFIFIITVRVLLEFDLLKDPSRTDTAKFVILSAVALTAQLLSFINPNLYCWSNLLSMTVDFIQLILHKAIQEPTSMRMLALVSAAGSMFFGIRSASTQTVAPEKDKEE